MATQERRPPSAIKPIWELGHADPMKDSTQYTDTRDDRKT